jgi:hypothetical protein
MPMHELNRKDNGGMNEIGLIRWHVMGMKRDE